MNAAMAQLRAALGDDAVLLQTRQGRHGVEITAAAPTVIGASEGSRPVSHRSTPRRQMRAARSFATDTSVRWPGTKARPRIASVCPCRRARSSPDSLSQRRTV